MTVTGTEVRDEVAKVWPTTARAVIGQRAMTGTRFLPKKSRRVARVAERVERAGEEVERETERWQSTRLIRTRAQPSGGETIVGILNGILAARLGKYSYQLTEQILRSAAQQLLHSRLSFMSSSSRSLLSWAPVQQQRSRPPAFTAGVKHHCVVSVLC